MKTRHTRKIVLLVSGITVACLVIAGICVALYLVNMWKSADKPNLDTMFMHEPVPVIDFERSGESESPPAPDDSTSSATIFHNGKYYELDDTSINILFLGIDATDENQFENVGTNAHQSDVLILIKVNPETREVSFINIPRNTIAEVRQYDATWQYAVITQSPICIQHAFGDGAHVSCAMTVDAVKNLLYGIPISKYVSMNMDGMVRANDAIGGITLKLLDDFTAINKKMEKGVEYTLRGNEAKMYLKGRLVEGLDGTNLSRIKRQVQYYKAFFKVLKDKLISNPMAAYDLYNQLKDSVYTDMELKEIMYLARMVQDMDISDDRIHTLTGTVDEATDDFYADEEALKELLINVFFVEVTE